MRGATCVALLLAGAEGLAPGVIGAPRGSVGLRSCDVVMGGATALAQKQITLDGIHEVMAGSQLMFCVRSEKMKVNEINNLRKKLPEGVQLKCVKNTLISIAAKDHTQFDAPDISSLCAYSNYWFFATETTMRESVQVWEDFKKATNKKDSEIIGGVFGAGVLDGKGVDVVSKLPNKQELMAKTAFLLTQLPTKIARGIKQAGAQRIARGLEQARGQKLVRAVKAASEKMP